MSQSAFSKATAVNADKQSYRSLAVIVALITCSQMVSAAMSQGFPVLYPFVQEEFQLSRAQVGLITSFLAGTAVITILPGGVLSDRFGVKRVSTVVMAGIGALILLFPLVHSFAVLLALVAAISLVDGPSFPTSSKAIIEWVPGKVRGLAMSIKQTGTPLVGAVAAVTLPPLALAAGWRTAEITVGVIVLLMATVFLLKYRDSSSSIKGARFSLSAVRGLSSNRPFVIVTIWGAFFVGLQFVIISYFILFLIDDVGLSAVAAGGIMAAAQFTGCVARIAWGALSDFLFKGRRALVMAIIGIMSALGLLALSVLGPSSSWGIMFLLAVVLGASAFSWHGVFAAFVGELADPAQIGTTVGLASTVQKLAAVALPPIFGHLADIQGSYHAGWQIAAGAALLVSLALLIFGREPGRN